MENPFDEDEDLPGPDRFKMPAERGTSGPSVNGANDEDESARFPMPARNPDPGIGNKTENETQIDEEAMDETEEVASDPGINSMKDVITVKCQKLNGKSFIGTVNFSEAKTKIYKDGLGLDVGLLDTVKISFNNCPIVTFKLKTKINVALSIKNQNFKITRI